MSTVAALLVATSAMLMTSLCMLPMIDASTFVLKPPKNPSKHSKWVSEGGTPTGVSLALDAGHRFASVGGTIVEVAWSESIRCFAQKHFEKLEKGNRMWVVLFVTTQQLCRHCVPAVLQYESAAAEFKDFVDFCAVSIFEQFDVVQWFTKKYKVNVDRVPLVHIFRPKVDRVAGEFEMLYYNLKIERDNLINALTAMLPNRMHFPLAPPHEYECLAGAEVLRYWLSYDKPTLLALPLKTKSPPAFLRSISEDLRDKIAVHQITEELSPTCDFLVRAALRIGQRPALLLVRPFKSLRAGDPAHVDHFRIPSDDTMSNGAFRRWLDRAWRAIGMEAELGQLKSRFLIPKYMEPEVLRAILLAEVEADREEAYNRKVDEEADLREAEKIKHDNSHTPSTPVKSEYDKNEDTETTEEVVDFRSEL